MMLPVNEISYVLDTLAVEVEQVNRDNGWYDDSRTFGDEVALLHSEVSEMLEAFRDHGTADATVKLTNAHDTEDRLPKPEGVGSEAADVLIRLLDTCRRHGIDLGAEYHRKLAYNRTRGYRHGGKAI